MSNGEIVETIYGKFSKFEIVKKAGGVFSNPTFVIRKNGEYWKSSSTLSGAVEMAEDAG